MPQLKCKSSVKRKDNHLLGFLLHLGGKKRLFLSERQCCDLCQTCQRAASVCLCEPHTWWVLECLRKNRWGGFAGLGCLLLRVKCSLQKQFPEWWIKSSKSSLKSGYILFRWIKHRHYGKKEGLDEFSWGLWVRRGFLLIAMGVFWVHLTDAGSDTLIFESLPSVFLKTVALLSLWFFSLLFSPA